MAKRKRNTVVDTPAKVVGSIDLSKHMRQRKVKTKTITHANNNVNMNMSEVECAVHLRKHGVLVDGKHRTVKHPKVGIRLLGQVDWLKTQGFTVLG